CSCWKTSWMCRQAATNWAAVDLPVPHGYQLPFISWPKAMTTGMFASRTSSAYWRTESSLLPAALAGSDGLYGSQGRNGMAPLCQMSVAWSAWKGSPQATYEAMRLGLLPAAFAKVSTGFIEPGTPSAAMPRYFLAGCSSGLMSYGCALELSL